MPQPKAKVRSNLTVEQTRLLIEQRIVQMQNALNQYYGLTQKATGALRPDVQKRRKPRTRRAAR